MFKFNNGGALPVLQTERAIALTRRGAQTEIDPMTDLLVRQPYELTEAQLAALPVATGAELLDKYTNIKLLWRRWNAEGDVIQVPCEYIDPEGQYAIAEKDALPRRMIYRLDGRPSGPAIPDFFILTWNANAALKILLNFP